MFAHASLRSRVVPLHGHNAGIMAAHDPNTPQTDLGWVASSPGAQALRAARREHPGDLRALESRVAHDLACLNYPPANWVPARQGPHGEPLLDVLVAGAGMCGQTVAYALRREGVLHQRVIDARTRGLEGPWATHARMEMLRSPKHLTGPDLGVPSLTFRAWYEARFGEEAWQTLHKVWRLDWRDYLLWVRERVGVTVEQGVRLMGVEPAGPRSVCVTLDSLPGQGGPIQVHVRKLVLALGREGSGGPRKPSFESLDVSAPAACARVFHSSDTVPFDTLVGARIGILGVGASAFDNAGLALESGAAAVTVFARRPLLPQVNKSKWTSFAGFFRGYPSLPDSRRLDFYRHVFEEQVPPPHESVLRCDRHAGFALLLGEPWLDVAPDAQGVTVTTPTGTHRFDAVILATGFDVDLIDRRELGELAQHVRTWSDRRTVGAGDPTPLDMELGRFPDLSEGFALQPRAHTPPDLAAALGRIHLFNWGSTISHGAVAGDIPGLSPGALRLSAAIARDLFVEDADLHEARMHAHDEAELKPTRWWVPQAGSNRA